jgi:hypothetical protein
VARDTALTAVHEGVEELFQQSYDSGVLQPEDVECAWASALRPTTRDSHRAMHGQVRPEGTPFESGAGNKLRYPGDPSAPASERVHCLCVVQRRLRPQDVADMRLRL